MPNHALQRTEAGRHVFSVSHVLRGQPLSLSLDSLGALRMADVKARRRAKRIVRERGLASLVNDTKWREFFSLLSDVRVPLEFKFLYEDQPHQNGLVWSPAENYIEGSGMGPELFVFIEWVRSSATEPLQAAAATVGLESELHDGTVTVYGYR